MAKAAGSRSRAVLGDKTATALATSALIFAAVLSVTGGPRGPEGKDPGRSRELETQILLDRSGFSPGEIDGKTGQNSRRAQAAFANAHRIVGGLGNGAGVLQGLGAGKTEPLATYTITEQDAAGPFSEAIPEDMTERAKLPGLYYTSVLEQLGEKFHSSPALLQSLNPGARFQAGEQVQVPNVLDSSEGALPQGRAVGNHAAKVVVTKKTSSLTVFDGAGRVLFYAPVTSGSEHDPLPLGRWVVTAVLRNPTYSYNPD
ncbi:MAG TPA: L,D-transpeptidase, partial [Candidatus Acidoferrum sp.]|nr:L,D-transpeptidase [Candidatus Acidoferrum sp.]